MSLAVLAKNLHVSWWGHLARLSDKNFLKILAQWRTRDWVTQDRQKNPHTFVKYARSGSQIHLEDMISSVCKDWRQSAQNRAEWASLRTRFVSAAAERDGFHYGYMGLLSHISNKFSDWCRRTTLQHHVRLLHVVDNTLVADACMGRSSCKRYASHAAFLKWSFHALSLWGVRPVSANADIIQQGPRAQNKLADEIANEVLNNGRGDLSLMPFDVNDVLLICTDGASRGNPGDSSCAALLLLMRTDQFVKLGHSGVLIGRSANVHAEFESACIGIRLFLL